MEDNTKNNDVVEENNIESNETNTSVEENATEVNDSTSEEVNGETSTPKKNNVTIIVLALVCLALLGYLIFTKVGTSKTHKLSAIYPTYFGDVDGEITLPKGWLYTEQGQLYRSEEGKATLVGQIVGAEMTEDEFTSTIDSLSSYYELNEVEGKDAKTYYFHAEQDGSVYDVYFFYKDSTFVQVGLLDASESEVGTVVNSLNY